MNEQTSENWFKVFLALFDEVAPETPEEIDEYLRENGYDPEGLEAQIESVLKLNFDFLSKDEA